MSDPSQEMRMLEAMLFASPDPVEEAALTQRMPEGTDIGALLTELQSTYAGHGIELTRVAGKWAFRTAPDLAGLLRIETKVARKLSRAAVETLAIIAYHQPVTRAEIEEIRGVAVSRGTLDILLEAGWIKPRGRRQAPGRPVTWGTSDSFLEHFGLDSIADLPGIDELKAAGLLDAAPVYGNTLDREGDALPDEEGDEDAAEENGAEGDAAEENGATEDEAEAAQLAEPAPADGTEPEPETEPETETDPKSEIEVSPSVSDETEIAPANDEAPDALPAKL